LVSADDLKHAVLPNTDQVNFALMMKTKHKLFRKAFKQFMKLDRTQELLDYLVQESYWLKPFVAYCHYTEEYKGLAWQEWEHRHRFYNEQLFESLFQSELNEVLYYIFLQYIFDNQLAELKSYAVDQEILIIGDLPIYVALNSADTWSRPDLFELDKEGNPVLVAGVPPDAFCEGGQLWGNPLYRWEVMHADNFDWMKRRIRRALAFADRLRLDHFIGYVNYWAIPAKDKTAINGEWLPGPREKFFNSLLQTFPREAIIAEDLGILTEEVNNLRDGYGFPGMIILQFCFQDDCNDILNFPEDRIIYTGTHDNDTTNGWFSSNLEEGKPDNEHFQSYLYNKSFMHIKEQVTAKNAACYMMELAYASPCHIAIVPMQDILCLDGTTRMNIPGTAEGNWRWRLNNMHEITEEREVWLNLNNRYERIT
jgi:4-alpha-glucanotransferase